MTNLTNSLRVLLSLVTLAGTMSINAQVIKVYKNGVLDYTATNTSTAQYKVVFEEAPAPTPDADLLSGSFSVSPTKTVKFTKGNLQATYYGHSYLWGFAENQWDCVGGTAGNQGNTSIDSQTNAKVVDLFCWSGSNDSNYGINTSTSNSTYSGSFKDWGELFPGMNYSTLSSAEWAYLLNTSNTLSGARTQNNRYAKAKVGGKPGLIIFPDNYNGTTTGTGINTVNSNSVSFPPESIPTDTWTTMESAGVVFLPAAGYRDGSTVGDAGISGYYWSSTADGESHAQYLSFLYNTVYPSSSNGRCLGYSVRLVSVTSK